jgi:hypothetical protein
MMREMDGAMRSTGAAAASGALPPGAVYMGQSSTYNSDGTRVTTSTRASGGVSARQRPLFRGEALLCRSRLWRGAGAASCVDELKHVDWGVAGGLGCAGFLSLNDAQCLGWSPTSPVPINPRLCTHPFLRAIRQAASLLQAASCDCWAPEHARSLLTSRTHQAVPHKPTPHLPVRLAGARDADHC